MFKVIGIFIAGFIAYGFIYLIVYSVASLGLDLKDQVQKANLAGLVAIATSILCAAILYGFAQDFKQDREDERHKERIAKQ